jgi:hypothetical protein
MTRPRRPLAWPAAVAVTAVALVLAACQSPSSPDSTPRHTPPRGVTSSIDAAQASARVDELIRASVATLISRPRLERSAGSDFSNCFNAADGGSPDRVVVGRGYWLRDVPPAAFPNLVTEMLHSWQSQGLTPHGEDTMDVTQPHLAATTPDGYTLSLDWRASNALFIQAVSPCIWPDAVPGHVYRDRSGAPVPPGSPGAVLSVVDPES